MATGFGENVAPTAAIQSILGSYPFSVGLVREILQNSDDAGARKQTFILDWRHHSSDNIYHDYLAATQGPALLAFNDALIQEEDWTALKNIHRSSKRTDTSKIGKYGIGFRSCYHVTDNPHILSGSQLAILDPKHDFAEVGGMRIGGIQLNIEQDPHKYAGLLSAFEPFLPCAEWGKLFKGTIFRFPLRTCPSDISKKVISPNEISDLLRNFALEELNVSLLFLRNISSVEIYEIDASGNKARVATSTVDRTPYEPYGQYQIRKAIIDTYHPEGRSEKREWRILHAPFSEAEAIEALSKKLGGCPSTTLSHHKLAPVVDLAIPLNVTTDFTRIGRLFTFLPLPLRTEFPVHINALFALTQSRQNLRNGGEVGIVQHSDDHALIEWNRILFNTYIPQAWANLLEVLVKVDGIGNVFDAWPRTQAEVNSGDYVYWKNIPFDVMQHALDLSIWPTIGTNPSLYEPATALIIAQESITNSNLSALVQAGLQITRPPQYLTDIICGHWANRVVILSPQVVHTRLLKDTGDKLRVLGDADAQTILSYLLSTADHKCITGLALVPSVGRGRIALEERDTSTPLLPLLEEDPEDLFSDLGADAVSLKRLPPDVRNFLMNQGCQTLNVAQLQPSHIVAYLKRSPYASEVRGVASTHQIAWLNKFLDWIQVWAHGSSLYHQLGPFYLAPITRGFQTTVAPIFESTGDGVPFALLELLAVPLVDSRLGTGARKALEQMKPTSNIRALLCTLPPRLDIELTEEQAQCICSYLIRALPLARAMNGTSRDDDPLQSCLRALPIYPVVSLSANGKLSTRRTSIGATSTVRGVNLSGIPVLPQLDSLVYLDLRLIDQDVLPYLDAKHRHPLDLSEMLDMMLKHLHVQSPEAQVVFVRYLGEHSSSVPRGVFNRLARQQFVPARDGSLQAPTGLVDPEARIACLFPGASSSVPDLSQPLVKDLVSHLRGLGILISQLSVDIVRERARFIAENPCPETENLARDLINLVNDTQLDCRRIFKSSDLSLSLKWVPTHEGLKSPVDCRDRFSHSKQSHLFDEALPLVKSDVSVSSHLRTAFEWEGDVALEVLSKQLVKILNGKQKPYNKVRDVIKEIGNRDITDAQLASLRQVLQGREWVPTRSGELKSPSYALLGSEEVPTVGFHCVNFSPHRHRKVLSFLRKMGCCNEPSMDTILEHLEALQRSDPGRQDPATIRGLVRLLTWLPLLTPTQRSRLIIPDTDGVLRGFNSICFNDIGERAYLVDSSECALAHPEIDDGLAQQLGLLRLGLFAPEGQDPNSELDMGEGLVTTIRNRLREYIDSQLLIEFLANASDAGATEFGVLLDEKEGSAENLLSPRCEPFQRGPALVIHNNGVFTKDDFKGILQTGIGGKAARSDTIGQFGLGALTMFHVTELAMIVSGDQVLFLNPCKAHLLNGRASIQVSLARMRKFYHGHLSSLLGVFGFHPPENISERYYYNGTIFRLPLRSSSQFVDIEPVFKKIVSFTDITSHFESIAPQCLLFTNISNISCFRRQDELQPMWSAAATRNSASQTKQGTNAYTITVSQTPRLSESQVWRVMSTTVHEKLPSFVRPLREQYRLRIPPVVRIAACQTPAKHHTLFSTLPLPISLDLPVHISASFILASDRRSIRLDEYENRETQYNRWLLTTVIPQLYMYLLEDLAGVSDNEVYWPGKSDTGLTVTHNTISTMIIDAVYQVAVVSHRPIFRSKFYSRPLTPQAAHLSFRLPSAVRDLLEIIKPQDLVELPSQVTGRLQDGKLSKNCISIVTPTYVQSQVLGYRSQLDATMLTFERAWELIKYQLQDKTSNVLFGLPFLPLEDGTFTKFEKATQSCFYVVSPEVRKKSIFKLCRLVHHDLPTHELLKLDQLNVEEVADTNIGKLLGDHLRQSPTLTLESSSVTYEWIQRFWETFPHLQISPRAIAAYPLIPTVHSTTYLSLPHCRNPSVVIADFTYCKWLAQCFTQMGFTPVNTTALLPEVRRCLNVSQLNIETVFSVLYNHPTRSIQTLFKALDSEMHSEFARWAVADMHGRQWMNLERYKILPIWKIPGNLYVSANDAIMLPQQIILDAVGPFCSKKICDYHSTLNKMGVEPCSSSIRSLLSVPPRLEQHKDGAYERLINALLLVNNLSSLPLPDSERAVRESNTLYSSRDDLFLAAFGADSNHFILPSFRHFEERLDHFGLRRQSNLTIAMFQECAEHFGEAYVAAIDDNVEEGFKDRAAIIFRHYAESLPLRTPSNVEDQWAELDKLCFVPRDTDPKPLGDNILIETYVASHAWHMPDVVSPSELVRPEFSAIAWTQRAFYATEPHPRLPLVHPSLSVPSVKDVVDHLVVLVTRVAQDHPGNAQVLNHIQQTYKWLNDRAEEAKTLLLKLTRGRTRLFLNVNNPTTESWKWTCGNRIWLETYDTQQHSSVREFLKPYRELLVAAGAVNIDYPDPVPNQELGDNHVNSICSSFDQMRREGICTDVHFSCNEGEPLQAHRPFLATLCDHFREMFSGSFSEAGAASAADPIKIPLPGFSRRCVELVLVYAYTGKDPEFTRENADIAFEMLELTHLWGMLRAHAIIQNVLIREKMVNPSNFEEARDAAEKTKASMLLTYCDQFKERNARAMQ